VFLHLFFSRYICIIKRQLGCVVSKFDVWHLVMLSGVQTVHVHCQTQPLLQLMVLFLIKVVFDSVQYRLSTQQPPVCVLVQLDMYYSFYRPGFIIYVGYAVTQLAEAQRYKSEGRGFDSRWCHWNFSLAQSFHPHYGPGVDSTPNRNEYQQYFLREGGKGGRCVGLTTLPYSCADCLEIWEPQRPGTLRACPGPCRDCFVLFNFYIYTIYTIYIHTLYILYIYYIYTHIQGYS